MTIYFNHDFNKILNKNMFLNRVVFGIYLRIEFHTGGKNMLWLLQLVSGIQTPPEQLGQFCLICYTYYSVYSVNSNTLYI